MTTIIIDRPLFVLAAGSVTVEVRSKYRVEVGYVLPAGTELEVIGRATGRRFGNSVVCRAGDREVVLHRNHMPTSRYSVGKKQVTSTQVTDLAAGI